MASYYRIIEIVDIPPDVQTAPYGQGFRLCSNGRCTHAPAYVTKRSYVTGRRGRVAEQTHHLCVYHAIQWCARHGVNPRAIPSVPFWHPERPDFPSPYWVREGMLEVE